MAFQLSPGVNVTEKDVTLIVPAVATTPGAIVAPFQWGPADEPTLVTSEADLAQKFSGPLSSTAGGTDIDYAPFWFTAANFLSYGNNLTVIRSLAEGEYFTAVNSAAVDSDGMGIPVTENLDGTWAGIFNDKSYEEYTKVDGQTFCAKYTGKLGNSLKVVIIDNGYDPTDTDYLNEFDSVPDTSLYVRDKTGTASGRKDEIHVLIIDKLGDFSGTVGTVLEKFLFVSKAPDARTAGGVNNYYVNVINNNSRYVRWLGHPTASGGTFEWGDSAQNIGATDSYATLTGGIEEYDLEGGSLGAGLSTDAELPQFYTKHFGDSETSDVSLLIAGPVSAATASQIVQIAETRKDCIAFISPKPASASVSSMDLDDITAYKTSLNYSSSYGVMDSGYKLQYDRYNDIFRYVPLCGDIAGCCVTTDLNRDPWFSPAGFDRGRIKNVVRLAFNPNKTERDELYRRGINPVVSFEGQGTVLYGDKTLLDRPSAFDRINVRRLFIVLEKAIATASKFLLFEFNDEFTRAQFRNLVEPYLRDVQGRRGITDFRVVCDETNNTPQVIDSNSFVGDIYIKPARSINFIQLNFIATPTGVSFEEVQGA